MRKRPEPVGNGHKLWRGTIFDGKWRSEYDEMQEKWRRLRRWFYCNLEEKVGSGDGMREWWRLETPYGWVSGWFPPLGPPSSVVAELFRNWEWDDNDKYVGTAASHNFVAWQASSKTSMRNDRKRKKQRNGGNHQVMHSFHKLNSLNSF